MARGHGRQSQAGVVEQREGASKGPGARPGWLSPACSGRGRPSLVVQQQHNGVELPAGPVVGPQWHDEVVQPVACRLCRDDDQLVLEAVGLGVLIAVVLAALRKTCQTQGWLPGTPRQARPGAGWTAPRPSPLLACMSPPGAPGLRTTSACHTRQSGEQGLWQGTVTSGWEVGLCQHEVSAGAEANRTWCARVCMFWGSVHWEAQALWRPAAGGPRARFWVLNVTLL